MCWKALWWGERTLEEEEVNVKTRTSVRKGPSVWSSFHLAEGELISGVSHEHCDSEPEGNRNGFVLHHRNDVPFKISKKKKVKIKKAFELKKVEM